MTIAQLKRYFIYLTQYIFSEKLRGLDFTMRDLTVVEQSKGIYYGYSKTDEKHLKKIFQNLDWSAEEAKHYSILDVGCGKGVVLKEATKYPFEQIGGVELSHSTIEIARKNFKILHLDDKIKCYEANAIDFDKYGEYNIFFFFNPFSEDVFIKVLEKIMKDRESDIILIYENPRYMEVFRPYKMELVSTLFDPMKNYRTRILRVSNR